MMQSFRQPRLEDFFFFFYYCCTQLFTRKTVTEIAVLRVKTVEILAPRQSGSITAWSGREYWTFGCRKTYRKKHLFFSVDGGGFQSYLTMLNRRLLPDHVVTVCVAATRLLSRGQRLKRGNKLYDEHKLRLRDPTSQLLTLNSSYSDHPLPQGRVSPVLPHLSSFIRPLCIQPLVSWDSAAMNSARGMQTNH